MSLARSQLSVVAVVSAAVGLGLVPLLARSDFLHDRGLWIVLDLVIGAGFTGVGLFAWYRRPDNRVGALMVATAFRVVRRGRRQRRAALPLDARPVVRQRVRCHRDPPVARVPVGRLQTTVDRVLVGIAYVATTVLWLPFVLFTDPVDLGCAECPENLLLIDGNAAFVDAWLNGLSVIGVTVALAVVARLLQRWHEASAPLRRAVTPVFVAGAALMVALAALLAAGLLAPFGDSVTMSLFYACAVALGLVPYVFLAGLVRGRWIRGPGSRNARQAPRPGSIGRRAAGRVGSRTRRPLGGAGLLATQHPTVR
jgi:hypothetical protein